MFIQFKEYSVIIIDFFRMRITQKFHVKCEVNNSFISNYNKSNCEQFI